MELSSSILEIKGIGEKTAKAFESKGVYTVKDILLNFPYNYIKYPEISNINDASEGSSVAVLGRVLNVPYNRGGRLKQVILRIGDDTGNITVSYFNMPYIKNALKVGTVHVFYGQVKKIGNQLQLTQPKVFDEAEYSDVKAYLNPVYHLSTGISNNLIKKALKEVISLSDKIEDYIPDSVILSRNLLTKADAIRLLHFPKCDDDIIRARYRMVFEEFFLFLMKIELNKGNINHNGIIMDSLDYVKGISASLDFKLTKDQEGSLNDILSDMSSDIPMQRLLQGDVGSGKTIVAFLSMLNASKSGYGSVLMAPTEVLATQHYNNLIDFLNRINYSGTVYLLTGSTKKSEKLKIKEALSKETDYFLIGTHAVLEEDCILNNLGLVITDEQHRFGVKQREAINEKGLSPHILVMSATPIPRTLSIILYGDLKVSLIKTMPQNRIPIKNALVDISYRKTAYEFIRKEVQKGNKAYIVCPMVEPSEDLDICDVNTYANTLRDYFKDDIKVQLLHGKMKPSDKNKIMDEFKNGDTDVLVSTTVIEVGVDVKNATVMMIENAERFGLAQLHQLRGRVGRGDAQSYCIFVNCKDNDNKRLEILTKSNDGFYIANEDLRLRGPGDMFGVRQSGEIDFLMADIYNDAEILKEASEEVSRIKNAAIISHYKDILQQSLNI